MPAPIITGIERQKRARHRVSIFLDGAFAFGVNDEIAYTFRLAKGMALDAELRRRMEEADALIEAKRLAQKQIARRARSCGEMADYLRKKGFAEILVSTVVADFRRVGLLDDEAFADAFVRDRMRFRPKARGILRRELLAKGIDEAAADRAIARNVDDGFERETALRLATAYNSRLLRLEPEARRRRVFAYLQRKGFTVPLCIDVLRRLQPEDDAPIDA